jgi:hypothetical protein
VSHFSFDNADVVIDGMLLGLAVHSRALGYTMGACGAGMSVYSGFFARGHEVVFPQEYGDGDWDRAAAGGGGWHGVQDLGSSRGGKKLKSSQDRLLVRSNCTEPFRLDP